MRRRQKFDVVVKTRRGAVALGLLAVLGAVVLALTPITGAGVHGNALFPHYTSFYGYAATDHPLPANPTIAQLRHAGVPFPQDHVSHRRRLAALLGLLGLIILALAVLATSAGSTRQAPCTCWAPTTPGGTCWCG